MTSHSDVERKEEMMDEVCVVCRGAIPGGAKSSVHTALCAEVIRAERTAAVEEAWGIIANAFGGDWSKATDEWRQAAERWRDEHITRRSSAVAGRVP